MSYHFLKRDDQSAKTYFEMGNVCVSKNKCFMIPARSPLVYIKLKAKPISSTSIFRNSLWRNPHEYSIANMLWRGRNALTFGRGTPCSLAIILPLWGSLDFRRKARVSRCAGVIDSCLLTAGKRASYNVPLCLDRG